MIGVRILAWIVDYALIAGLWLLLSPLGVLGEYVENDNDVSDPCGVIQDQDDDVATCFDLGDKVYFSSLSDTLLQNGVVLVYGVAVLVLWQGLSGRTVGKALAGLRTVDENGQGPGIGKALVRTLLWIVDSQPCGLPLVGLATGLTSTGHRRVGDMAAKTYVVRKTDAGRPVIVPGATPTYGVPAGYGAPPGYGQQAGYGAGYGQQAPGYPTGVQQTAGYPTAPPTADQWGAAPGTPTAPQGGWGAALGGVNPPTAPSGWPGTGGPGAPGGAGAPGQAPATPPTTAAPPTFGAGDRTYGGESPGAPGTVEGPPPAASPESSGERPAVPDTAAAPGTPTAPGEPSDAMAPTEATAPADAAAQGADQSQAPAEATAPASAAAEPAAAQTQSYNPQWDAARGTYIQWDAARGQWLQWDDTAKQWRPI